MTEPKPISFKDFVQSQIDAVGVINCTCGRGFGLVVGYKPRLINTKAHCPNCGSTWLLGSKRRRSLINAAGILVECKGFCCRRCQHEFNEMDIFMSCCAPRLETKVSAPARKVQAITGVNVDELREKLLQMRKERQQ